jgi:hypothetical protein
MRAELAHIRSRRAAAAPRSLTPHGLLSLSLCPPPAKEKASLLNKLFLDRWLGSTIFKFSNRSVSMSQKQEEKAVKVGEVGPTVIHTCFNHHHAWK